MDTISMRWTIFIWQIRILMKKYKSQNNLNEILTNFTDTDYEVQTFDDSSYIDIDSMTDNLKPQGSLSLSWVSIFRV